MTRSRHLLKPRRFWLDDEVLFLHDWYPHSSTIVLAAELGRPVRTVYQKARALGFAKSAEYLASDDACRLRRGDHVGRAYRFPKGHVPANKGIRRPGWAPGRMKETQFKKGQFPVNKDPDFYVIGALRTNTEGYVEMRTSFRPGSRGWTSLARILWEDARGAIPRSHALCFKDGDKLNVELENLELVSRADLMRRNTVHNLPAPLKSTIQVLGQLKRRIREKQDRRSA